MKTLFVTPQTEAEAILRIVKYLWMERRLRNAFLYRSGK